MKNSRTELDALQDQRNLIEELVEKERANEREAHSSTQVLPNSQAIEDIPPAGVFSPGKGDPVEFQAYCSLLEGIISLIDACQSSLSQAQYSRVRSGILRIHSDEVDQSKTTHGTLVAQLLWDKFANLYHE